MSTNNTLVHVPDEVIMSKIIVIRDKKVLLDRDIAALYGITSKRLNEPMDSTYAVLNSELK